MGIAPDPLGYRVTFNGECLGHSKGIVPDNEYIKSLQNEIMYSYNIPLHLFAQGNLQMTNTVQCLAKSYGNHKPEKQPCKGPSILNSLLGATVIPTDGSWALTLRNGVMSHESIAYTPERKKWVVIAENGRFPTDYGTHPRHIHNIEDPTNTNDIMMYQVDDPSVISFARSTRVEVVSRPEPTELDIIKTILGPIVDDLTYYSLRDKQSMVIGLPAANTPLTLKLYNRISFLCNTYKVEIRNIEKASVTLITTKYNWQHIYNDITT